MTYDMLRPNISIEEKSNAFDKLRQELKSLDGAYIKVGFPEGKKPGAPKNSKKKRKPWDDMSEVASVATWLEFGVPKSQQETMRGILTGRSSSNWKIPPRPFFRTTIDGSKEALNEFKKKIYDRFLLGRLSPKGALDNVGLWMQNRLRQSILKVKWAPNAEKTKQAKGSSKPLIDTGQMINSVTFVNSLDKK